MRIDKYLKTARIIKRRSVASQACTAGAIKINNKTAKPGSKVNTGDIIIVELGSHIREYEVLIITETMSKERAPDMYRQIK